MLKNLMRLGSLSFFFLRFIRSTGAFFGIRSFSRSERGFAAGRAAVQAAPERAPFGRTAAERCISERAIERLTSERAAERCASGRAEPPAEPFKLVRRVFTFPPRVFTTFVRPPFARRASGRGAFPFLELFLACCIISPISQLIMCNGQCIISVRVWTLCVHLASRRIF